MSEHSSVVLLDRSSPLPLWAQLLADLRRRLEKGELDESFPGELELAESYGVSRNTVREAVRRLRAEGTVVAERGRRPRVVREILQPIGAFYSLFDTVRAAGLEQRSIVRSLERRRDAAAESKLGLGADATVVFLERVRLADGEPFALDRVWMPDELGVSLFGAELETRGLYDELAARSGARLTGGEERLRAVVPPEPDAELLGLQPGGAALAIERLGRIGERAVEWRRTLVRGDRFCVLAELAVAGPAGRGALETVSASISVRPAPASETEPTRAASSRSVSGRSPG